MDEITAEYAVDQLSTQIPLRFVPRTSVAAKTDLGRVRDNNEDKFEYYETEDPRLLASRGLIYVVCDGMGGHAGGQFASELAAKTFIDVYLSHTADDIGTAVLAAIRAANRYVMDVGRTFPARRGMGTTLTALILWQDQAYVGQVGDSRAYRLRNGDFMRLTHDHTFVEESVRIGTLTAEEAAVHPHRHVLTRAIGADDPLVPDIYEFDLQAGDVFLLCSDGLLNHVEDDLIAEQVRTKSPAEATWNLVNQALAAGGTDNTTVMIVRVDALEEVSAADA